MVIYLRLTFECDWKECPGLWRGPLGSNANGEQRGVDRGSWNELSAGRNQDGLPCCLVLPRSALIVRVDRCMAHRRICRGQRCPIKLRVDRSYFIITLGRELQPSFRLIFFSYHISLSKILGALRSVYHRLPFATGNMFQNQLQTDVTTILMLLGESTIWKAIWTRFRSRRCHWKHWVFAVSPGWAPLAATLFAIMGSSIGAVNLIFDRPPESTHDTGLILTNLNSGASHFATNAILQDIWSAWNNGPRQKMRSTRDDQVFEVTREVGVVDIDLDKFSPECTLSFWAQFVCLIFQFAGSFFFALLGWGFETFLGLLISLLGQSLLLTAVLPSQNAWSMPIRGHRGHGVMLHRGLNTTEVLIIRTSRKDGKEISLEEFVWKNNALRGFGDTLKLISAAMGFVILTLSVAVVGWMSNESRTLYLAFGSLGMFANAFQAACPPDWLKAFRQSFSGTPNCAPVKSSLLSAVGILLAAKFPAARAAAQTLYPANSRFDRTVNELESMLDTFLCSACRNAIRCPPQDGRLHQCERRRHSIRRNDCSQVAASVLQDVENKQHRDALATVSHLLSHCTMNGQIPNLETARSFRDKPLHDWGTLTQ